MATTNGVLKLQKNWNFLSGPMRMLQMSTLDTQFHTPAPVLRNPTDDDNHPEHAGKGPGLSYEAQAVDGGILHKTCQHTHDWCFTGPPL